MTTYYICLKSTFCRTELASHSSMLQLQNCIHYIRAYLIYRTKVLFNAAWYSQCTMFCNCHHFFERKFSGPAVKGRVFSGDMLWVFVLLDPAWESKLTRNDFREIIFFMFWLFLMLNSVSDLQRLYTRIIISNRPNSVPILTHHHQSSW